MRRGTLTPAQRRVWEAFRDLEEDGVPPSYSEVADHLDLVPSTVHEHAEHLLEKGWLEQQSRSTRRGVRAVEEEYCPHCGGEL